MWEVWNKISGDHSDGYGNLVSAVHAKRFRTKEEAEENREKMECDYPMDGWVVSRVTF